MMKRLLLVVPVVVLLPVLLILLTHTGSAEPEFYEVGGGEYSVSDEITDAERDAIWVEIERNLDELRRTRQVSFDPNAVVLFDFPLERVVDSADPGYFAISNFVDSQHFLPQSVDGLCLWRPQL